MIYLASVNAENKLCKYEGSTLILQTSKNIHTFTPRYAIRVEKQPIIHLQCKKMEKILKFKFRFNKQADEFQAETNLIIATHKMNVLALSLNKNIKI